MLKAMTLMITTIAGAAGSPVPPEHLVCDAFEAGASGEDIDKHVCWRPLETTAHEVNGQLTRLGVCSKPKDGHRQLTAEVDEEPHGTCDSGSILVLADVPLRDVPLCTCDVYRQKWMSDISAIRDAFGSGGKMMCMKVEEISPLVHQHVCDDVHPEYPEIGENDGGGLTYGGCRSDSSRCLHAHPLPAGALDPRRGFLTSVNHLRDAVATNAEQIALRDAEISANIARINELEDTVNRVHSQKIQMNADKTRSNKYDIRELERVQDHIKRHLNTAKRDVEELERVQGNIKKHLQDARGDIATLERVQGNIKGHLNTAKYDIEDLDRVQGNIKKHLQNARGDIATLERIQGNVKSHLNEAKGDIDELERVQGNIKVKVNTAGRDIDELERVQGNIKKHLNEAKGDIDELESARENIERRVRAMRKDVDANDSDLAYLEEEVKEVNQRWARSVVPDLWIMDTDGSVVNYVESEKPYTLEQCQTFCADGYVRGDDGIWPNCVGFSRWKGKSEVKKADEKAPCWWVTEFSDITETDDVGAAGNEYTFRIDAFDVDKDEGVTVVDYNTESGLTLFECQAKCADGTWKNCVGFSRYAASSADDTAGDSDKCWWVTKYENIIGGGDETTGEWSYTLRPSGALHIEDGKLTSLGRLSWFPEYEEDERKEGWKPTPIKRDSEPIKKLKDTEPIQKLKDTEPIKKKDTEPINPKKGLEINKKNKDSKKGDM